MRQGERRRGTAGETTPVRLAGSVNGETDGDGDARMDGGDGEMGGRGG